MDISCVSKVEVRRLAIDKEGEGARHKDIVSAAEERNFVLGEKALMLLTGSWTTR